MSLALFNAVPAGAIEILYDEQNQPWIHRAQYGRYLGLQHIHTSIPKNLQHEVYNREQIVGCQRLAPLGESKNVHDTFVSLNLALYIAMRCYKDNAKPVREWLINEVIPRGLNKIITEKQQAIEDNNRQHQLTITQFQENLHQSNNQLQAITYQNQDLVHEIQELRQRYVAPLMNSRKNNIIIIIRKHTISDNDKYHHYPYYIARIQKRKRYIKLRWFQRHFPQHEIIVELDCANSIVSFNRFEEDGFVERKYNHFRLLQDLTRDDLYDMGIPAIDYEDED